MASRTAMVAAVFCLVVCSLLIYDYTRRWADDPIDSPVYLALEAALKQQPKNEQLKEQIRVLDTQLRAEYFRQRNFTAVGAILLLGGVGVFLVAAKTAQSLTPRLPEPGLAAPAKDLETQWTRVARWGVGVLALAMAGGAVALIVTLPRNLPYATARGGGNSSGDESGGAASAGGNVAAYPAPSAEEIAKNWPQFRGPGGSGGSAYTNVPDKWDGAAGEGILWKVAVPLPGNNSPVVWGPHVFLSGASEEKREVYCFDANSGELLWQREAPSTPQSTAKVPKVLKETGYAAPSLVTDGRQVFAIFANGDLAAMSVDGELKWSRSLGIPENSYGHAASLVMHEGLVFVQLDQGSQGKDEKSRLYAFRAHDGEIVWQVRRAVPNSWGSPIVIQHDGRWQVIACSDPWVISYSPTDGKELWRAKCLSGDCGVSPVYAGGLLQVGNEYCQWSAIRPDGSGDVTDTHIVWSAEDGLPDTCSPLATEEYVFLMPSASYFTCLDAKTGEMLWDHAFDDDMFTSSPSLVGDRVYLFSNDGDTFILKPGREGCEQVGQGSLGEPCVTSPAFADKRIYIRGKEHLYCIGMK